MGQLSRGSWSQLIELDEPLLPCQVYDLSSTLSSKSRTDNLNAPVETPLGDSQAGRHLFTGIGIRHVLENLRLTLPEELPSPLLPGLYVQSIKQNMGSLLAHTQKLTKFLQGSIGMLGKVHLYQFFALRANSSTHGSLP